MSDFGNATQGPLGAQPEAVAVLSAGLKYALRIYQGWLSESAIWLNTAPTLSCSGWRITPRTRKPTWPCTHTTPRRGRPSM